MKLKTRISSAKINSLILIPFLFNLIRGRILMNAKIKSTLQTQQVFVVQVIALLVVHQRMKLILAEIVQRT